ncbi:MAG: ATP-binding protein, partial [Burkholderiaceae bacterium]|nr:ATP-binding protein [Burkholderiaceae bacterium]
AEADTLYALAFGPAVRSGLLLLDDEGRPLCERSLRVAAPIAAALAGVSADWPGSRVRAAQAEAALVDGVPALRAAADRWAASLAATPQATLALRSASAAEARGLSAAIIERLGARPAWFDDQLPVGADVWLMLSGRVPVFALQAAPGELAAVPPLPGYDGPVLVTTGLDGGICREGAAVADWRIPAPDPATRGALWRAALGDTELAAAAAARYRAGVAQISEHARLAQLLAAGQPSLQTIAEAASMTSAGRALDALAQALPELVPDGALVVNDSVGADLERALQRCAQRERLHAGLGEAARTRACDGVRMLFTGLSGTGKSLAGQWLAARLGLPIYRVDLAAMLSKWIGDTEKNLAELLGRAEHADVVLLFDEADTLFGKRTEIATANDRFANAQTNYLLQRIESHAGIVVLTSNSRNRFDPAFVRRLDFIIDFSAPDAQARRALWQAHLGEASSCDQQQLNRLAALADLAGGNIRNAVLAAAASAQTAGRRLDFDDIAAGVRGEYRKLGRTAPPGL